MKTGWGLRGGNLVEEKMKRCSRRERKEMKKIKRVRQRKDLNGVRTRWLIYYDGCETRRRKL